MLDKIILRAKTGIEAQKQYRTLDFCGFNRFKYQSQGICFTKNFVKTEYNDTKEEKKIKT